MPIGTMTCQPVLEQLHLTQQLYFRSHLQLMQHNVATFYPEDVVDFA